MRWPDCGADGWQSPAAAAEAINKHGLHVLVNLNGYTNGGRFWVWVVGYGVSSAGFTREALAVSCAFIVEGAALC